MTNNPALVEFGFPIALREAVARPQKALTVTRETQYHGNRKARKKGQEARRKAVDEPEAADGYSPTHESSVVDEFVASGPKTCSRSK
jgi:hypothetical protein